MTVTINKTDGTILTTIADGAVDTTATNIALIGRLYRNYGELINENLVKLLENFAATSSPSTPIVGQLWFNKTTKNLNVYRDTGFVPLARLTSSSAEPSSPAVGDFWWDLADEQLRMYNGSTWTVIAPGYTADQGKTGIFAETILDTTSASHIQAVVYQQAQPIAIFSRDPEYTPQTAITGFTTIKKGLNLSSIADFYLHGTATNADKLDNINSSQFLRSDENDSTSGTLTVANDSGLIVGVDNDITITVDSTTGKITKATAGNIQFIMGTDLSVVINDDQQVLFTDGSELLPSVSFINSPNTGVYSQAPGSIDFTANATTIATIDDTGLSVFEEFLSSGNATFELDVSVDGVFTANAEVVIGSLSTDLFTINADTASIPNNLTFVDGDVNVDQTLTVQDLEVLGNILVQGTSLTVSGDLAVTGSTVLSGPLTVAPTDVNDFKIDSLARVMINATSPATGYTNEGDVTLGTTNAIYARNVPKYVVTFNGTLAGLAILKSHHVSTVTRLSAGSYAITLRDDLGTNIPLISNYPTVIGSANGATYVAKNGASVAGDTSINLTTSGDYTLVSVAIWDGAN